jgi:hypothetical protein
LDRLGYEDLTEIIKSAKKQKAKKLVFMMHSFSLIKFNRHETHTPLKADYRKIDKLDRFLRFLAEDPQILIRIGFSEISFSKSRPLLSPNFCHSCFNRSTGQLANSAGEQAYNSSGSRIFLLAGLAAKESLAFATLR